MQRTLVGATGEVVSKASAFGRDSQRPAGLRSAVNGSLNAPTANEADANATFRLRHQKSHALACFAWQTAIARVRMTARPLKETLRVHRSKRDTESNRKTWTDP
jgi:hypothetical protein